MIRQSDLVLDASDMLVLRVLHRARMHGWESPAVFVKCHAMWSNSTRSHWRRRCIACRIAAGSRWRPGPQVTARGCRFTALRVRGTVSSSGSWPSMNASRPESCRFWNGREALVSLASGVASDRRRVRRESCPFLVATGGTATCMLSLSNSRYPAGERHRVTRVMT